MNLLGLPLLVVGSLLPGSALGVQLGRKASRVAVVALVLFLVEFVISTATGWPLFGLSAYVLCVGRAAARVDPRVRALGSRLALDPLGDVEIPLVAAGVFGGAALAFGMQVSGRVGGWPAVVVGLVFGGIALAIDLQHGEALADAGALRGHRGPVLMPHLTVADHLAAAGVTAVPELIPDLQRRPRHLTAASRDLLASVISPSPVNEETCVTG